MEQDLKDYFNPPEIIEYRKQMNYKLYLKEWESDYIKNNNSPNWIISNNIGDPYSYNEWLEKIK